MWLTYFVAVNDRNTTIAQTEMTTEQPIKSFLNLPSFVYNFNIVEERIHISFVGLEESLFWFVL